MGLTLGASVAVAAAMMEVAVVVVQELVPGV